MRPFLRGYQEFIRNTDARKQLFEEDSKRIPTMIGDHVDRDSSSTLRPKEVLAFAPTHRKTKFGHNVYSHAVQLCLIANGWWRHERFRLAKFRSTIESGIPIAGEINSTVDAMKIEDETAKIVGIHSFNSADKGSERVLEAADFSAWH